MDEFSSSSSSSADEAKSFQPDTSLDPREANKEQQEPKHRLTPPKPPRMRPAEASPYASFSFERNVAQNFRTTLVLPGAGGADQVRVPGGNAEAKV